MNNQYLFIGNGEGIHTIGDNIDHWINSDEVADIVFSFGGEIPKDTSLEEKAKWLLSFSACWDLQGANGI